jgi:hypothetical protein
MKRLKPDIVKREADNRTDLLIRGLILSFGFWNATKIARQIERCLKTFRQEKKNEHT